MKEFVSLTMFAMETEEKQFLVIIATAAMTKCFIRNMNLRDTNYYWKKWVDWISTDEKKFRNLKNVHFEKKDQKVKNIILYNFITTIHSFVLKMKTVFDKKVVKCVILN